jgi:hypothetical protein
MEVDGDGRGSTGGGVRSATGQRQSRRHRQRGSRQLGSSMAAMKERKKEGGRERIREGSCVRLGYLGWDVLVVWLVSPRHSSTSGVLRH